MKPFPPETEELIKKYYTTLNEKDRRRYAAIEAIKLGHGGVTYIANLLNCSRTTVTESINELHSLAFESDAPSRIRTHGGGRKPYHQIHPTIDQAFVDVIKNHTAGDPCNQAVRWTNLTHAEIANRLADEHGITVSKTVVKKLLKKHHFKKRKAQKKKSMKSVADQNEQFQNIAQLIEAYQADGNPVISVDTKKKEYIGNFYRDGYLYTTHEILTFDHDFNSAAEGVVIPHGIYDLTKNRGFINIGTSRDTSQFATESLGNWWAKEGQFHYPCATEILMLADGGGSNNSRHYIFKFDLQNLVDEIGIPIRVAHYPAYCSKYNPIEHRMFPHVTRACQGVIFKSVSLVKQLIQKTQTQQGLRVTVDVIDKVYETGRKVAKAFKENMPILFDDYLPKWNYTAVPKLN